MAETDDAKTDPKPVGNDPQGAERSFEHLSVDARAEGWDLQGARTQVDAPLKQRFASSALPFNLLIDRIDGVTGLPSRLQRAAGQPTDALYIRRVIEALHDLDTAFETGLGATIEYVADPLVQRSDLGTHIVRVQQYYRGIPVFDGLRTVFLDSGGLIEEVKGARQPVPQDLPVVAHVSAAQSVANAADYLRVGGRIRKHRLTPAKVHFQFPFPSQPTVLSKRGFTDSIPAWLTLFHVDRHWYLCWRLQIGLGDGPRFDMLLRADGPKTVEVLYCQQTASSVMGRASVVTKLFGVPPGQTDESLPLPLGRFPDVPWAKLPAGFPWDWIDKKQTEGLNAIVKTENRRALKGKKVGDEIVFSTSASGDHDQELINAFYWVNFLHDFFYIFGFREADGNLQNKDLAGTAGAGTDGDPAHVFVYKELTQALPGNVVKIEPAYSDPRPDGRIVKIHLGRLADSGRRAALDPDSVIHEYVHGVVERLVGGPGTIHGSTSKPQARALSEGFCDYFAVTIPRHFIPGAENKVVMGDWLANNELGVRGVRYDDSFPGHYGLLVTTEWQEAHAAGRVWAATLVTLNRELGAAFGSTRLGDVVGWQIVVESLKNLTAGEDGPTFLDAREAIRKVAHRPDGLRSHLTPEQGLELDRTLDEVFLRFGMGPLAKSPNPGFSGIEPDFGPDTHSGNNT